MLPRPAPALTLLLCALSSAACVTAADAPLRALDIPAAWLDCPTFPAPPDAVDDRALATLIIDAKRAHGACRDHLHAVDRALVR